ncbi:hypothetical protein F8388_026116 [Cannabis sativa]|uniref:Uncharacterized protein n=1 Tax=Cannabis sativa TaxID=3483 RepID=A0A7J6G005_CANSA|nr:hypothetical protein F8388_026116 [Cannabis sativa]
MTKLEELHLGSVDLSSPLPKSIANLSSLISLSLKHSNLYGEFPQNIFHLRNIQVIDVSSNDNLRGFLPINFSSYSKLKSLNLHSSSFSGRLTHSISNLMFLSNLDLSGCAFSGTIPSTLFIMPSLQFLGLRENQFTGPLTIPSSLKNLSCLSSLDVGDNNFNGQIPSILFQIPMTGASCCRAECEFSVLKSVVVSAVRSVSPGGSCCIVSVASGGLIVLDLSNNNFNGEILPCLDSISSLQWLKLSNNKFEGSIPLSLGNLTQLSYLDLSKNRLSERIPQLGNSSMFCTLSNLGVLDVSNNQLIGSIPQCLGSFSQHLQVNNFEGHIPQSVENMIQLESLDLSNNKLSRRIPQELGNLTLLAYLNLSNNQLTGMIPQGTQMSTFSKSLFNGNVELCGLSLSECEDSSDEMPSTTLDHESEFWSGFGWKAVAIGYACSFLGGVLELDDEDKLRRTEDIFNPLLLCLSKKHINSLRSFSITIFSNTISSDNDNTMMRLITWTVSLKELCVFYPSIKVCGCDFYEMNRIGSFHSNATKTFFGIHISLHPNVTILTPTRTP